MTTVIHGTETGRMISSGAVLEDVDRTDKNEMAHIVMVPPGEKDETPQAYVMRARVEGFPVTALCGFTWVPNKQASGLPVCEHCKFLYENVGSDLPDRHDNLPEE